MTRILYSVHHLIHKFASEIILNHLLFKIKYPSTDIVIIFYEYDFEPTFFMYAFLKTKIISALDASKIIK
jgi:hypothetical protein